MKRNFTIEFNDHPIEFMVYYTFICIIHAYFLVTQGNLCVHVMYIKDSGDKFG